jgi:hypothetical protein
MTNDKHEKHNTWIMACDHVIKNNNEAIKEQFPDLLCESCVDNMANDVLPNEVHLVCKNCILSNLTRKIY